MAIEDAAVLGSLLSRLSKLSDLEKLVRVYEHLRKDRTARTQAASRDNRKIFHLSDGPALLGTSPSFGMTMAVS